VSLQAVSALERGFRKAPYRDTVDRLADALGLTGDARSVFHAAAERGRARGTAHLEEEPSRHEHNLPRQLTSFVGREKVVGEILALASSSQLVTIVGPGGAGKTRSAIQVGARSLERWPDGVWFVELAGLTEPAFVPSAIAAAVGCSESASRPALETLTTYLASRRMLIVLDNCEHLIDAVRETAFALVRACPDVTLLATSREALNLRGEHVYPLPALECPAPEGLRADEALAFGAVALFADRASSADARFEVTDSNAPVLADLVRRLDGLPLAIELAAARVKHLAPAELLAHLDDRLRLLARPDRTAAPRQQTIRAMIDWSYDLLTDFERALFAQLAIFAGGFTLESAVLVCSGEGLPKADVLDILSSLVDKSLVVAELVAGVMRYRLLESTREYALEKLRSGGDYERLAQRHASAYTDYAERLDAAYHTAAEHAWFPVVEAELDNWRAALEWSLTARNDVMLGQRLSAALARAWSVASPVEGQRRIAAALNAADAGTSNDLRARLEAGSAIILSVLGDYKAAIPATERALLLFTSPGDRLVRLRADLTKGAAYAALGRYEEAISTLEGALSETRQANSPRLLVSSLTELGTAESRNGRLEARRYYRQAQALCTLHAFDRSAASIAALMAEVEFATGDAVEALRRESAALSAHLALRNRRSAALDLCNMTAYLIALDRFDEARSCGLQALKAARDVASKVIIAFSLQHLAATAALRLEDDPSRLVSQRERAARLWGFVDARLEVLGAVREYTEQQEYERVTSLLSDVIGKERLAKLAAQGVEWADETAIEEALRI